MLSNVDSIVYKDYILSETPEENQLVFSRKDRKRFEDIDDAEATAKALLVLYFKKRFQRENPELVELLPYGIARVSTEVKMEVSKGGRALKISLENYNEIFDW